MDVTGGHEKHVSHVERLDDYVTLVRAANPGPMTLDGTNTYLVGAPGSGGLVCVDPGPLIDAHRWAIERAVAELDAEVVAVLLTHHHADHAEAAEWAASWGVSVRTGSPALVAVESTALSDGETIADAGAGLEVVATPGHASDHLSFRVRPTGALLTGDHLLGRGSTVVLWPDGDMGQYMASLERVATIDAPILYPGHGPVVAHPRRLVREMVAHRKQREAQIVDALAAGAATPAEVVAVVYADVDSKLHPMAERTVRAHLAHLVQRGLAREVDARFFL